MKLLFICSGNICRSPMAEALSEVIGHELGIAVTARSAGTLGILDAPADRKAIAVCRELGIRLTDHRSQAVSDDLIEWADWILVMEFDHAAHLRQYFPAVGERLLMLGQFAGVAEIDDPVGGWKWTFRRIRKQIDAALRNLLPRLAAR